MSAPEIDLDDLAEAFADASEKMPYFLDRQTGEILLVSDALGFIDAERQRLTMAEEPGRYAAIPAAGDGWLLDRMEAFLDAVEEDAAAERLEKALDANDPFAAWKRVMTADEALAAEWLAFLTGAQRERAAAWLAGLYERRDAPGGGEGAAGN